MSTFLNTVLTLLFAMPFLGFMIVFAVVKLITKNTRKSVHSAIDYSTIFFIVSVCFLVNIIWEKSLFWLILLVLIVAAMIFVLINWRLREEIVIKRVSKGFWRFSFLFFSFAYMVLIIYGFMQRALTFTFS